MVRTVALGLLISGITPIALTNSADLSINVPPQVVKDFPTSCQEREENLSCPSKTKITPSGNHSDVWVRGIAPSLLPNSPFLLCGQGSASPGNKQWQFLPSSKGSLWKTNLSLSSLGTITNPVCGFSWQQQLNPQPIPRQSRRITTISLEQNSNYNYISRPKFPQLSRSSLIVDFPQENSSFIPRNTKLANPAPETKRIASPFGWRTRPYTNQLQFHQGIDYGAPFGSSVVAVGNGIVTKVITGCADFGNLFCGGQLGNWIEIDHGNGIIGTYGHLKRSSITITEGARVRKNQSIAQVGSSGWSTGAHLDFRLKINGKHENPAQHVMEIEPKPRKSVIW